MPDRGTSTIKSDVPFLPLAYLISYSSFQGILLSTLQFFQFDARRIITTKDGGEASALSVYYFCELGD